MRAARRATAAFDPAPTVDVYSPGDAAAAVNAGVTALVCDCVSCTHQVLNAVQDMPTDVAVYCVGAADGELPAAGYYVMADEVVTSIVERLNAPPASRPTMLWLAGHFIDRTSDSAASGEPSRAQLKYSPGWRSSSA